MTPYGVRMTTVDRPTTRGWVADDSTFGARLALVRQHMRWGNVKEAAQACGLPTESWRSWERDGRVPQRLVEIAATISNETGCDLSWLIMGPKRPGTGATNESAREAVRAIRPSPDALVTESNAVRRGPLTQLTDRPTASAHRPGSRRERAHTGPSVTRPAPLPRRTLV